MASEDEDGIWEETTLGEVILKKGATAMVDVDGTFAANIGMLVVITVGKVGCGLTLGDEVDVILEESLLVPAITFVPPIKEEEEETLSLAGGMVVYNVSSLRYILTIECTGVCASDDCCLSDDGG